jgi:hypothetical protein
MVLIIGLAPFYIFCFFFLAGIFEPMNRVSPVYHLFQAGVKALISGKYGGCIITKNEQKNH